ncbi:hypothetical protein [Streptomyces anulatus]|uniref:hypothetical protein n=1 Tax=Streptomyces anulatus TaxID=1892 RepID=UPI00070D6839|nr:hypothetical protein [Streptomyces anulatus]WTC75974.1 hypothetical protein OG882_38875 [Streptomyces anulatus]WUD86639.1 hypothetical protein OG703_00145 [Streptomyces anulatus]
MADLGFLETQVVQERLVVVDGDPGAPHRALISEGFRSWGYIGGVPVALARAIASFSRTSLWDPARLQDPFVQDLLLGGRARPLVPRLQAEEEARVGVVVDEREGRMGLPLVGDRPQALACGAVLRFLRDERTALPGFPGGGFFLR